MRLFAFIREEERNRACILLLLALRSYYAIKTEEKKNKSPYPLTRSRMGEECFLYIKWRGGHKENAWAVKRMVSVEGEMGKNEKR